MRPGTIDGTAGPINLAARHMTAGRPRAHNPRQQMPCTPETRHKQLCGPSTSVDKPYPQARSPWPLRRLQTPHSLARTANTTVLHDGPGFFAGMPAPAATTEGQETPLHLGTFAMATPPGQEAASSILYASSVTSYTHRGPCRDECSAQRGWEAAEEAGRKKNNPLTTLLATAKVPGQRQAVQPNRP